jgi:hypothetical protein
MTEGSYKTKPRDLIRWAIHIPIGCVIAYMILKVSVALGITVGVFFLAYEVLEDWRVRDRSFKDIFGSLIGMIATGLVIYLWF